MPCASTRTRWRVAFGRAHFRDGIAATGGEATSVALCHELGLDYVSCSPYRVPLARLGAAQAALKESGAAAYTAAGG
jgi:phosphoenolpyruvate synthase/pyruvate phosphate dikinase